MDERLSDYVLRHTRLNPRDVIIMGNALLDLAEDPKGYLTTPDSVIREHVARVSQRFATAALAQAGNQILTNVMPWDASRHFYMEAYVLENVTSLENVVNADEYSADAVVRELLSVLRRSGSELITEGQRVELDAEADRRFGTGCEFTNVLWQNRLLGYATERGGARFYSGDVADDTTLPPDGRTYVLNSILLDLVPGIEIVQHKAFFPVGNGGES